MAWMDGNNRHHSSPLCLAVSGRSWYRAIWLISMCTAWGAELHTGQASSGVELMASSSLWVLGVRRFAGFDKLRDGIVSMIEMGSNPSGI
jgi:hypothetical protein